MAIRYFAMDAAAGLTLPLGLIRGLSDSEQGLRDAGFAAATYTGARFTTLDDASDDWNNNVQPGWFLTERTSATDFALGQVIPPTDLDDLQAGARGFVAQELLWFQELTARSLGQPEAKILQGRARLSSALGGAYLICTDASRPINDRKAFITLMARGALDIQKVDDFYTEDTGTFPALAERDDASSEWYVWVDIDLDPVAQVNLVDSVIVTGNVPASLNLLGDWAADIAA